MDTNNATEPPDAPESSPTANIEAVQPAHGPTLEPPEPYNGPNDKDSVIDAVIRGALSTADAAALLNTSTGSIRKLKSRETARRERAAEDSANQHTETTAPMSHLVSPIQSDASQDSQDVEAEGDRCETRSETLTHEQALQLLQPATEGQSETAETAPPGSETDDGEEPETPETVSRPAIHPNTFANIANPNAPRSRKVTKRLEADEGYFERDELDTLDNLHRIITRNAKRAESGKDCQGWTASLAIVLDLRRRAAGKSSTLVKEPTAKASSTRNSIVFIGNPAAPSPKVAKPTPITIDMPTDESLSDAPPALKAALQAAPAYVRSL